MSLSQVLPRNPLTIAWQTVGLEQLMPAKAKLVLDSGSNCQEALASGGPTMMPSSGFPEYCPPAPHTVAFGQAIPNKPPPVAGVSLTVHVDPSAVYSTPAPEV